MDDLGIRKNTLIFGLVLFAGCLQGPRQNQDVDQFLQASLIDFIGDATGACNTTGGTVKTTQVRATSATGYTRCDLADGGIVSEGDGRWDIIFQRFKVGTGSGTNAVTGGGLGGACLANTTNFDSFTTVSSLSGSSSPNCPLFAVDINLLADAGAAGGVSTYNGSTVFQSWFNYNIFTHTLAAKGDVYVIKSSDGTRYYKIQFLDYYSSSGTSGYPKFKYSEITL